LSQLRKALLIGGVGLILVAAIGLYYSRQQRWERRGTFFGVKEIPSGQDRRDLKTYQIELPRAGDWHDTNLWVSKQMRLVAASIEPNQPFDIKIGMRQLQPFIMGRTYDCKEILNRSSDLVLRLLL
jgi:hypothetical protein